MPNDNVQSPAHYTWHPSGIECIETIQDPMFYFYSAWTYLWRAPYKGTEETDLKKALFYVQALLKSYEEHDDVFLSEQFDRWLEQWHEVLEQHGTTKEDFLEAFTPEYRTHFKEMIDIAAGQNTCWGEYHAGRLEIFLKNTIHNREGMPVAVAAKEET